MTRTSRFAGANFEIAEFGGLAHNAQPITAGPGCTQQSDEVALCPIAGVIKIQVATKGGDDSVDIADGGFDPDPITVNAFVDFGAGSDNRVCSRSGAGNDTLVGGDGGDCIRGGPGNDTLHGEQLDGGGSGNDNLDGAAGNDVLKAGKKEDQLLGGLGDDNLNGGVEADNINGDLSSVSPGPGIDTVDYSGRSDNLDITLADEQPNDGGADDGPLGARDNVRTVENVVGGSGDDVLEGDSADNRLNGQGGQDDLFGFGGNDTLIGSVGADDLLGGEGLEDLAFYADHASQVAVTIGDGQANDGNIVDAAGSRRDNVGGDVENVLGTSGNDGLTGNSANNKLDGGAGADNFFGLGGTDTVSYASHPAGVTATIGGGADDGNSTDGPVGARDRIQADVENLDGGPGSDTLTGDLNANKLIGNNGADTLDGGLGDDSLDGGLHPDTLIGGGGAGDQVTYASRPFGVVVTLDDVRNDGSPLDRPNSAFVGPVDDVRSDVEDVIGSQGGDRLEGSSAANRLDGQGGDDTLEGFAGADSLFAGGGSDVLGGGTDADRIVGASQLGTTDLVDYSDHQLPVEVTLGNSITGGTPADDGGAEDGPPGARDTITGVQDVIGGSGDDRIVDAATGLLTDVTNHFVGGLGNDQLEGGEGNGDVVEGGLGADLISGGPGEGDVADYGPRGPAGLGVTLDNAPNDGNAEDGPAGARDNVTDDIEDVIGGSGPDSLQGDPDPNKLEGGEGADQLRGRVGADELSGGGADDLLLGGDDADTMSGGEGSDTVSYAGRNEPVGVSLNLAGVNSASASNFGGPLDGPAFARDTVDPDVENATGGNDADTLIGESGVVNVLSGGPGGDFLNSGNTVNGVFIGPDVDGDQVKGAGGADTINTVDGVLDDVSCRTEIDTATVDLKDTPPDPIPDCETVNRAAVDQHPTLRIVPRPRLLTEQGELVVRLHCPRELDLPCKGKLSARTLTIVASEEPPEEQPPEEQPPASEQQPDSEQQPPEELATTAEPGPSLDSHRYRIRSGRIEAVHLSLSQADVNRILEANWIRLPASLIPRDA